MKEDSITGDEDSTDFNQEKFSQALKIEQEQRKEKEAVNETSEKGEEPSEPTSEETKESAETETPKTGETSAAENTEEAEVGDDNSKPEMTSNGDDGENGPTSEENKSENMEIGQPIETITSDNSMRREDDEIDVQDADDYLLYLEEILKSIHREFYLRKDAGDTPDLKQIVPEIKARVLKDTSIVFSGLVANHIQLEHSRAYQVAVSLGAKVTQDLIKGVTTHLVAVRPGTAKVGFIFFIFFLTYGRPVVQNLTFCAPCLLPGKR